MLLGGVSIFGGRGGLHGVIAGVLLLGVARAARLQLDDVPANVINIVTGAAAHRLGRSSTERRRLASADAAAGGHARAHHPGAAATPVHAAVRRRRSAERKIT